MENWYLPMTIVPGLGLIILSTSNLIVTLSNEISAMISSSKEKTIITRKLTQLKLLNTAMVFFYIAVALLLIAAVVNGLNSNQKITLYASILAITCALIGIITLIKYSFKAVTIRQDQFKNRIN